MNVKRCLQVPAQNACCAAGAILFVRVVMGIAFILHGWGKIQMPMGWMGPEAPVPGILQLAAAVSEFGGGILLVLGLFTPIASFFLGVTMVVATGVHMFMLKDPFVAAGPGQGSYELALLYLSLCVLFMGIGPGKYSADAKIFGARS